MQIGNIKTETDLFLAPMAGMTGSAVRSFFRRHGAGLAFTEMISVQALSRNNKKTLSMLEYRQDEKPVACQLFGNEPAMFVKSALIVKELGFDIIDINCGCPARRVVKSNNGVMLMNKPEEVAKTIESIRQATGLPVSVKLRLGLKNKDELIFRFLEVISAAEPDLITVHLRYAEHFHKGEPDLDTGKRLREKIKTKYVINGGIDSAEKAQKIKDETGCDGLMLGRPALNNLLLFNEILSVAAGFGNGARPQNFPLSVAAGFSLREKSYYTKVLEFFSAVAEEGHPGRLKKLVPYVIKDSPGSKTLREKLFHAKTTGEFMEIIKKS